MCIYSVLITNIKQGIEIENYTVDKTQDYTIENLEKLNALFTEQSADIDPADYEARQILSEKILRGYDTEPEKYRYDSAYGKLYEWNEEQQAYIFVCSNPFKLSESELISQYEEMELHIY